MRPRVKRHLLSRINKAVIAAEYQSVRVKGHLIVETAASGSFPNKVHYRTRSSPKSQVGDGPDDDARALETRQRFVLDAAEVHRKVCRFGHAGEYNVGRFEARTP